MNNAIVIEIRDGLIAEVYDHDGNVITNEVTIIDHDNWESGSCAFCNDHDLDSDKGVMHCRFCEATENSTVPEWFQLQKE